MLPLHTPLLPALLSAACRGSHQARKHLLLASIEVGNVQGGRGEGGGAAEQQPVAAEAEAWRRQQVCGRLQWVLTAG